LTSLFALSYAKAMQDPFVIGLRRLGLAVERSGRGKDRLDYGPFVPISPLG